MLLLKFSVKAALWRSLARPVRITGPYQGAVGLQAGYEEVAKKNPRTRGCGRAPTAASPSVLATNGAAYRTREPGRLRQRPSRAVAAELPANHNRFGAAEFWNLAAWSPRP